MALQFETRTTNFTASGTTTEVVSFNSTVLNATVVLQGFYATYGNAHYDTSTNQVQVSSVSFSGNTVQYVVTFNFNDTANQRHGDVTAVVIAETA